MINLKAIHHKAGYDLQIISNKLVDFFFTEEVLARSIAFGTRSVPRKSSTPRSSLQFKVRITIHGNIGEPLKNIHILQGPIKPNHNDKRPSFGQLRQIIIISDLLLYQGDLKRQMLTLSYFISCNS